MRLSVAQFEGPDQRIAALDRDVDDVVVLEWWGSECVRCGNTNPTSMVCEQCNRSDRTFPLWMERARSAGG